MAEMAPVTVEIGEGGSRRLHLGPSLDWNRRGAKAKASALARRVLEVGCHIDYAVDVVIAGRSRGTWLRRGGDPWEYAVPFADEEEVVELTIRNRSVVHAGTAYVTEVAR